MTINRTELFEWSLSAAQYYLAQTMVMFNDMGPEFYGMFEQSSHSITCLSMFFDIHQYN